jgi:tetratricopeptide (TPR) repeat protein
MATPRIIELDEAVSRIKQACEDQDLVRSPFFFMVGAGISCPSVPIATDVISHCKEVSSRHGRNAEPPSSKDVKKDSGDQLDDYSYWFQNAYGEPKQRQGYLQKLIEGKPITHANFRLAHLLLNDTISNIVVTTNFDDFLSNALTLFGKPHIVCDHPRTVGRIQLTRSIVQIIHLHGTYWFYDCCNLRGELEDRALQSRQSISTMASLLDRIMGERSPLVTGYSGWESDVFMASLKRRLEATDPPGTNVYWFCYQRSQVEQKPEWLRNDPNVSFVVPPVKATETESVRMATTGVLAAPALEIAEQSPTEKMEEPTLPADRVLVKLIQAFKLDAPELTNDPLGFFASQLERSLPRDNASEADIYAIKNIIDRVKAAKQRELEQVAIDVLPLAEQTLERVRDALRRADYSEVVKEAEQIELESLSTKGLDELSNVVLSAATGLNNPNKEISAYDLVIRVAERVSDLPDAETQVMANRAANAWRRKGLILGELNRGDEAIRMFEEIDKRFADKTEPALREQVAMALNSKGFRFLAMNRPDEAIMAYDEMLKRYGDAKEPALRGLVAMALRNKGFVLAKRNRGEEAILVFDEIVKRYAGAEELPVQAQVAMALVNKGFTLGQLNRSEEARVVYNDVVSRYAETTEFVLREQAAVALNNTGVSLGLLDLNEEAITVYDDLVSRYGEASEPSLRAQVARALNNKSFKLGAMNRRDESIRIYDDVVRRYGEATEPALREQVAIALNNKAVTFAQLDRSEEAITVYDEVVKLSGAATEPALRAQVAIALNNKCVRLGVLNRNEEAITVYDEVVKLYGAATEPALREQVAIALRNKGVRLGELNRNEEAITVYDDVVKRFGEATEPALREQVAMALNNMGIRLGELNRSEEEIVVYDEVVKRYGEATEPALREQVALALNNKGFTLDALNRSEQAITVYDQVVKRYGEATEPALRNHVGNALNFIGFRSIIEAKSLRLKGNEAAALEELFRARENIMGALARDSQDPIKIGNQAYIAFLQGQKEEARELLSRAISLGGESIKEAELADAEINRLPEDDVFCEMVRSIVPTSEEKVA